MPNANGDNKTRRSKLAQLSLGTLLALMFIGACISRLAARFGFIVFLLTVWAVCLGATLGAVVGAMGIVAPSAFGVARGGRAHSSQELRRFIDCVGAGIFGGVAVELAVYVFIVLLLGPAKTEVHSVLVDVTGPRGAGPSGLATLIFLFPAVVGALANSIAFLYWREGSSVLGYLPFVSLLSAGTIGLPPAILLIALLVRPPGSLGVANEWSGLWPFAALIYFAFFSASGAVVGALAAALHVLSEWSHKTATRRTAFLSFWILLALLLTEAAVWGWFKHTA
jgi:hypothetical protein